MRRIDRSRLPFVVLAVVLTVASLFVLTRTPRELSRQPFPDAAEYADSANRLAHGDGYSTTVRHPQSPHEAEGANPPRYPPGYPLALAPFTLVGHFPANVEFGQKIIVVVLLLVIAWAALELGGPWAATIAVTLALLGTFVRYSAILIMSDAFAAALAVALLPLVKRRSPWAVYAAGFLAGYGVVVRNSGVVILACLLIVLSNRDRVRALVGAIPPIAGVAIYQWTTFGRPWATGYSYWLPRLQPFAVGYITKHPLQSDGGLFPDVLHNHLAYWACGLTDCTRGGPIASLPSWSFYPVLLIGCFWIFSLPFVSGIGLGFAVRSWRDPVARLILLSSALTLLFFLPYFYQSARFMAAPAMMLLVSAAVGMANFRFRFASRRS